MIQCGVCWHRFCSYFFEHKAGASIRYRMPKRQRKVAIIETSTDLRFYSARKNAFFLSNFFPSRFSIDSVEWPSVEHYFQAMKFPTHPKWQDEIRIADSPAIAKRLGSTRAVPIREDWDAVRKTVMITALRAKFDADASLKRSLLATGE
jgi:N-glycosidase YbiA